LKNGERKTEVEATQGESAEEILAQKREKETCM
jgi:hypothetical protein